MEQDKAMRIWVCLNQLMKLAEKMDKEFKEHHDGSWYTIGPLWNELGILINSPEYKELKEWAKGKK